jgi:hypothetical protein
MENKEGGDGSPAMDSRTAGAMAAAAGKAAVRRAVERKVAARLVREAREREVAEERRRGGNQAGGKVESDGLAELLGSKLRLKILLLMLKSGPVYSLEIVQLFEKNLFAVQSQLHRMEKMGMVKGISAHRRIYYDLDEKHPLHGELTALLEKHLRGLPWREQSGYYMSPDLKKRENLLGWWF